jgi:ketosteroid isomerase-like protein
MRDQRRAMEPEEVTRLVVERLNAGDAAGVAALYEPQAVLAYPADRPTTGRGAIQAVYQQMVDAGLRFGVETPLPTVRFEDLALTSTRSADNTGVRVQVLRRQPDGSWLRIIDRPEVPQPWPLPRQAPTHPRPARSRSTAGVLEDRT